MKSFNASLRRFQLNGQRDRTMHRATLKIDEDDPSSEELRGYFSQVFSSLDENPREMLLKVVTRNGRTRDVSVDFDDQGRLVFSIGGRMSAVGDFRGRWLPEHPVPLRFERSGVTWLHIVPADANRCRVRRVGAITAFFLGLKKRRG